MKTKARVTRGRSGNYDTLTFEILASKYGKDAYLTPIGTITWQGDSRHAWYAMRIATDCEIHNHHYLLSLYKLACYVNERAQDKTPIETAGIIGLDEHFHRHGMFISIADNGKQVYDVKELAYPAGVLCRIVAANELMAFRIIDGMVKRNELKNVAHTIHAVGERLAFSPTNLNYN